VPNAAPHLDAHQIAELVAATRPARVLLTHIQMGLDRAAAVRIVADAFRGPVGLVEPGDNVDLRRT
jgi:phosphoribosyl 1,2-cyclic phosphodiesterase